MKKFIENMNTILGIVCLIMATYGIHEENYVLSCAYALYFIAFQQVTE
jgi:hypothetical protein